MKFKVGDTVVIVQNTSMLPSRFLNTTQTVSSVAANELYVRFQDEIHPSIEWAASFEDIMLSEIYNSPLMKALR